MCNVYKRVGALFCAAGVLLLFIAAFAFNSAAADESGDSTLTLKCVQDDNNIVGMVWQIFRVGENQNGNFVLNDEYSCYPVDLSKIKEDSISMTEAATTLTTFALLEDMERYAIGKTNSSGILEFRNLAAGLYLVCGSNLKVGTTTYVPTSFLIDVDGTAGTSLDCYPKVELRETLPGAKEKYMLRKYWANAEGLPDGKPDLTVEIYKDYTLFDTIYLTQENSWSYEWEGDPSCDWKVKEVNIPLGCYVIYRNNEKQYIIMNSFDDELLIAQMRTTTTTVTTTTSTSDSTSSSTTAVLIEDDSKTGSSSTSTATVRPADSSVTSTVVTIDDGGDTRTGSTSTSTITALSGSDAKVTSTSIVTIDDGNDSRTLSTSTVTGDVTTSYYTDENGSTIYVTGTTTKSNSGNVVTSRTNAKTSNRNVVNTTTTIEKLPQTGQLWWPVPVMALGGLVFVAVGLRLILDSRKED